MRRSRTIRQIKRTGDIRKDVSESQLAGIGAVALAYNEAEALIDILVSLSLGLLTNTAYELTSRINGIEGKIELAKIGMRELAATDAANIAIAETLGEAGFKIYKKYRDAVIHAQVLDAPAGIALAPSRRGKRDEVLLTVAALNGLYDRLALIRLELIEACNISIRLFTERRFKPVRDFAAIPADGRFVALIDQTKRRGEQEIQESLSRLQDYQKRRLSLPPLPKFPEEPPTPQGLEAYGAHLEPPEEQSED